MVRTAGERVLGLVEIHREEAAVLRRHHPSTAEVLERLADEYEQAVRAAPPEWVALEDVQGRTGWSSRWLWKKAAQLEKKGEARKVRGQWEFRRAAAEAIPVKPEHRAGLEPIRVEIARIRETAARLAGEE